ncbi:helix-turn-helix domain-containing protein [Urbifossiella limnaea]|uniref:Uncharacterized protein n=1 Tax=Urbifossiella limnaea TaxID=2528023 RepID=A0A517XPK2_9BACT|nr:helix-turn-helix domain-containing protein [Urbifossiella limnaea]QDU19441.1 hypothetical protein ETAA1_13650 [Urbifossiella limnaea]
MCARADRPRLPLIDWLEVKPGVIYSTADLAGLMGVSESTAIRWVRGKRLSALPRGSARAPYRILGVELLKLLGNQAGALSRPSETASQRGARVEAAKARVRQLVGDSLGSRARRAPIPELGPPAAPH